MRYALIVLGILALWTTSSVAQAQDNRLRGIRQMDLLVESLAKDEDAKKCRISDKELSDSFNLTTAALAKFRIVKEAETTAYINPTVLFVNDGMCVYNIQLQVYSIEDVRVTQSNRIVTAVVELWESSNIGYASPDNLAKELRTILDRLSKKLITDWDADNR